MFFAFLFGCRAPRENPLDANNPVRELRSLSGIVLTSTDATPIANAHVLWEKEKILAETDSAGQFFLANIKPKSGYVIISREGFYTDSILIIWADEKRVFREFTLNTKPIMNDIQFYSKLRNRFISQEMTIGLEADIIDLEGDLRTIRISNQSLGFEDNIPFQANIPIEKEYQIWQLNSDSYQKLIGVPFSIESVDFQGRTTLLSTVTVERFITDTNNVVFPKGNVVVNTDKPLLRWNRYSADFEFSYTVEVFTDDIPSQLIWEKNDINYFIDSVTVDVALDNLRSYTWFVWVVDLFGNRFSSNPASFTVNTE
jgi:hypothetical protein